MIKAVADNITDFIRCKSLFEVCLAVSISVHVLFYGAWYFKNNIIPVISSNDINIENLDIDFNEIPPELLGGDSDPALVEVQEWIEGSSINKKCDAPVNEDQNTNALSGTGTDKDGYLYSVKGDHPPRPVFNFDLKKFFPYEARKNNITNQVVVVRIQVDDSGRLISSNVVSQAAGFGFDEAAIEVLSRARFVPGYKDGAPVKMVHDLSIRFMLE
jgi:periplasmic protein TonB